MILQLTEGLPLTRSIKRIYRINSIERRILQLGVHLCCVWRCFTSSFRLGGTIRCNWCHKTDVTLTMTSGCELSDVKLRAVITMNHPVDGAAPDVTVSK